MGTYDTRGGSAAHDPAADCDPPLRARHMADMLMDAINRDRTMGDQVDVRDIEYDGFQTFRVKLESGEIFIVKVSEE